MTIVATLKQHRAMAIGRVPKPLFPERFISFSGSWSENLVFKVPRRLVKAEICFRP